MINILSLNNQNIIVELIDGHQASQLSHDAQFVGVAYFHQYNSKNYTNLINLIVLNEEVCSQKVLMGKYNEVGQILAHECYHAFQHMLVELNKTGQIYSIWNSFIKSSTVGKRYRSGL